MPSIESQENKRPVIAHVDRLVIRVPPTRANVEYLSEHFEELRNEIATRFCGNSDVERTPHSNEHKVVRLNFPSEISRLTLQPPYQIREMVLSSRRFPSWPELFEMGFKANWLALLQFTDRRKWNYQAHTDNLYTLLEVLEPCLELEPMVLEIAFDTLDEKMGMFFRKYACLKRAPRDNTLFHFIEPGVMLVGPSPNGSNEYHGHRPKGWDDNRSTEDRSRGGRRQIFSYDRQVNLSPNPGFSFHRFELRFFRDYLRDYSKQNRIGSIYELIDQMEHLATRNLRFKKVNLKRLGRERPQSRFWNLRQLSTKGQLYIMRKKGMNRHEIEKYVEILPFPNILYVTDPCQVRNTYPDDGLGLWFDLP